MATTEDSSNLSRALGHLAKTEEKLEIIQHKQADADYLQLFELIKDYVALMGAVKDALTERQKAFQVKNVMVTANHLTFLKAVLRSLFIQVVSKKFPKII